MLSTTGGKLKVSSKKILKEYSKIKGQNKSKNVVIGFGSVGDASMELTVDTPQDIGGFQFDVLGTTLGGASGGLAAEAGFTVSTGGETVLGFSFTGGVIPAGSSGLLTTLSASVVPDDVCIDLGTGAISDGDGQALDVSFGEDDCSYIPPDPIVSISIGSVDDSSLEVLMDTPFGRYRLKTVFKPRFKPKINKRIFLYIIYPLKIRIKEVEK